MIFIYLLFALCAGIGGYYLSPGAPIAGATSAASLVIGLLVMIQLIPLLKVGMGLQGMALSLMKDQLELWKLQTAQEADKEPETAP